MKTAQMIIINLCCYRVFLSILAHCFGPQAQKYKHQDHFLQLQLHCATKKRLWWPTACMYLPKSKWMTFAEQNFSKKSIHAVYCGLNSHRLHFYISRIYINTCTLCAISVNVNPECSCYLFVALFCIPFHYTEWVIKYKKKSEEAH